MTDDAQNLKNPPVFCGNTADLNVEQLTCLSLHIFKHAKVVETFKICEKKLHMFIRQVFLHHRDNPYHNNHHACHVQLNTFRYLSPIIDEIPQIDTLTVLLSALCHDLDHAGVTNGILISTNNELGVKYPTSPLENHSIAEASAMLETAETNFLENLKESDMTLLKASFKDLILCTDVGNQESGKFVRQEYEHYYGEDEKKESKEGEEEKKGDKKKEGKETQETEEEKSVKILAEFNDNFKCRLALYRVLLLMADIGIVAEKKPVYVAWVVRLFKEMSSSDEKLITFNYYQGQEKFLKFYAAPMMEKLKVIKHLKFGQKYVDQFTENSKMMAHHVQTLNDKTHESEHISVS